MGIREDFTQKLLANGGKIVKGRSTKYVQIAHPYLRDGEFFWLGSRGSVRRGKTVADSIPAVTSLGRAIRYKPFVPSITDAVKIETESATPPKDWAGPTTEKPRQKPVRRIAPSFAETPAEQKARKKSEWEAEYYASLIIG